MFRFTVILALSVSGVVQAAEIAASKLQGNLSVSPMGAATYSIPLSLPTGVNGATPKLSLEYSSQAGMGIAGMGWNIGGLSAITRCPQSKAVDGVQKALTLSVDDRFCMDGQRLILTSGTYGTAGSTYQTEINNFARVTALPNPNNTSLIYFKVDTKDGKVLEYGSRLDAVLQPNVSGKSDFPLVWMISSGYDRDQKGQLIAYDYTNDNANGQQTLSRVRYAYDVNNANNLAEVVFTYNTIPSTPTAAYPLPPVTMYMAGGSTSKRDKQLARVTVHSARVAGQPLNEIHNYQLVYEVAPNTRRQRLKEVKSCMPSGNCLPALQFESKNATASVQSMFGDINNKLSNFGANQGWGSSSLHPRQFTDINNDGLSDVIGFYNDGVYTSISAGNFLNSSNKILSSVFSSSEGWNDNSVFPRQVVDINSDGLPDIVGFSYAGITLAINNANNGFAAITNEFQGIFGYGNGWVDNNVHPRQLVDVNGDGYIDIVGFNNNGVNVALNTKLNNQYGFFALVGSPQPFFGKGSASGGWIDNNIHPRQLVDINGDSLPDIVGFSDAGVMVSLNNGIGSNPLIFNGFSTPVLVKSDFGVIQGGWSNNNTYPRQLADINGDGLLDIVGFASSGVMVALNNGNGGFGETINKLSNFGVNQGWSDNNTHPRQLADINGDGLLDVVGFASSGVMVALNNGNTFDSPLLVKDNFGVNQGWTANHLRFLSDINGDGKDDIVGFSDNGIIASYHIDTFQADLITTFDKGAMNNGGIGRPYFMTYLPLTNNEVYIGGGQGTYPNYNLRFPMYVVRSISEPTFAMNYAYGGLTANANRGLNGFSTRAEINFLTKMRSDTFFSTAFPSQGMPLHQTTGYCATVTCLNLPAIPLNGVIHGYAAPHSTLKLINVLSELSNTLDAQTTNGLNSSQKIYFPYIKSSTTKTFEPPVVGQ